MLDRKYADLRVVEFSLLMFAHNFPSVHPPHHGKCVIMKAVIIRRRKGKKNLYIITFIVVFSRSFIQFLYFIWTVTLELYFKYYHYHYVCMLDNISFFQFEEIYIYMLNTNAYDLPLYMYAMYIYALIYMSIVCLS